MATRQELRLHYSNPIPNTKEPRFSPTKIFDNMGFVDYTNTEVAKSEILRRPANREIPLTSRQE